MSKASTARSDGWSLDLSNSYGVATTQTSPAEQLGSGLPAVQILVRLWLREGQEEVVLPRDLTLWPNLPAELAPTEQVGLMMPLAWAEEFRDHLNAAIDEARGRA